MSKTLYHPTLDGVTVEVEDDNVEAASKQGWLKTKPKHYTGPTDVVRATNVADVPRLAPAGDATEPAGSTGTTKE